VILSINLPFVHGGLPERIVLEELLTAHRHAAQDNPNASSQVAAFVLEAGCTFSQAVAAAVSTLGGLHAPLRAARDVYRYGEPAEITARASAGEKIPGFGNSFHRDRVDPAFANVGAVLELHFPAAVARIEELQAAVWAAGKKVWPNAALFTAAVCEICRVPDGREEALFLMARIPAWAGAP
jgi:citrate synthase